MNLQEYEHLHWRDDVHAYEMSQTLLDGIYTDCRYTPTISDDPVRPSDRAGAVLVTEGYLSHVLTACELRKAPTP